MTDLLSLVEPVRRLVPTAASAGNHPLAALLVDAGTSDLAGQLANQLPGLVDAALRGTAGSVAVDRLTGAGTDTTEILRLAGEVEAVAQEATAATGRAAADITLIVEQCIRQIMVAVVGAPLSPGAPAAALQIACLHLARAQERLDLLGAELAELTTRVDVTDAALPTVPPSPDAPASATSASPGSPGSPPPEVAVGAEASDVSDVSDVAGAPTPQAAAAVEAAKSAIGTPYVWGGTSPATGVDCSGLTQWAYGQAGVDIPRTADQQAVGTPVGADDLAPGDLVVWDGHVAMVTGDGQMIEAGDPVQVNPVRTENIGMGFLGFYRPTA
ncbi:MAG: C40 family peptidase [Corynebacterium sp.]|uniref:C40 family peptidase n=1 Tax=unclassified Corynebacterium TaxID=2624378 RepID=UPI00264C860B|nr:C40 family peptidase [Corynebacterium sp.]MDN6324711.1 C40 family peptidase [Corynebacterium sp.]